MADANLFTYYEVYNLDSNSNFDRESLKRVLDDKQIRSENITEIESGWRIKIDCGSVEVITQRNERLRGESDGQRYDLVFISTTLPPPELFPSLNESCTGNPKGTILVPNYPPGTTAGELLHFFESGISYGGTIQHIHFEEGYATITFFNPKVADIVHSKSPILFKQKSINIYKDAYNIKEPAKENASQIATKTISVDNVPEEIDLETAELLVENSPITSQTTILVHGVPENITSDEVKAYFKNFKWSNGGQIQNVDDDRKKGIKITFASSDIAKNVLGKRNHKIREVHLKVSMYISPQPEEKQLLIHDIKKDVPSETLQIFLESEINLNVDLPQKIQPGIWLVNCENKIDFENVKTTCKEATKPYISETYPKVKRVESLNKIIVKNIPEDYSNDNLMDYFRHKINPDHFVSLKMIPGKRCIVTFKDYTTASQWSKVQHDKFDCDLYYDYEDGNEVYMDISISSAFKLQFIMSHKQKSEDELKDCGFPVWCESSENSLKLLLNKGIKVQEIERKVKEFLETISEVTISVRTDIFSELKNKYSHKSNEVHVYFDDKNLMVYICSFDKSLTADYQWIVMNFVDNYCNIKEELELSPHKIYLLYADDFPSKIETKYEILKITKEATKIIFTGSVSDINNAMKEILKYLFEFSSTQCPLPHHASEIVTKKKVKEYLRKNLNEGKIICSWEINPEKQVIIYALNNENHMSANDIFQKSFMELNLNLTDPKKKLMKGEHWQTFLKSMSTKYNDIFHIDDQQKERISIVTTKEFSQDIGKDFGTFFDTNAIYTSTLPLKCGFYDFLKTFCMTDINKFCEDYISLNIGFQDDQTIHISATNQVNNDASDFVKSLTKSIIEKSEMISDLGFKKFLKTDAADRMFRELSQTYKCIILKEEEIKPNNIGKRSSADFEIKYANSSILLHMGDITELEVDAIVNPANKQLQHIGGLAKRISEKGGPAIQTRCKESMATKNDQILREGSVEVTTAAVCPTWKDGNNYEVDSLSEAVTSSLQAAEQQNCSSIAIPAISTGIFRFPIDKATEVIVSNIKKYLDNCPESCLKYIYLVNTEECVITAFKRQLQFIFLGFATLPKENNDQTEGLSKGNISPSPVNLFFYANSKEIVNETKEAIISQYKKDYLISKEIEDINIPELPIQQMQNIMKLQCEHEVKIEIKPSKITINGYKDDVLSVTGDIKDMILSFVNEMKTELIQKIVQWKYITYDQNKSSVAYSRDINQQLEEAYANDKMLKINRGNAIIVFDLRKPEEMIEYDESNPSKTIKIVRNDKTQGASLPEHWSPMGNNNYLKVELKPGDEYDKVKNAFPTKFQIVKIERIQNRSLYIQYQARLEQVNLANPKDTINETQGLWHGTSENVTERINTNGFDRSYCGTHGMAYGQGVYFATDLQYSLDNSPQNAKGRKHIYMCNVITGMTCEGYEIIKRLPDNPHVPEMTYNSTVDKLNAPTIYGIFYIPSAYPVYLITCE